MHCVLGSEPIASVASYSLRLINPLEGSYHSVCDSAEEPRVSQAFASPLANTETLEVGVWL